MIVYERVNLSVAAKREVVGEAVALARDKQAPHDPVKRNAVRSHIYERHEVDEALVANRNHGQRDGVYHSLSRWKAEEALDVILELHQEGVTILFYHGGSHPQDHGRRDVHFVYYGR